MTDTTKQPATAAQVRDHVYKNCMAKTNVPKDFSDDASPAVYQWTASIKIGDHQFVESGVSEHAARTNLAKLCAPSKYCQNKIDLNAANS